MARTHTAVSLSFLDVFCCAMGAMVLLAVIFAIVKYPVELPLRGDFILLEITAEGTNHELGALVTTPRNTTYAIMENASLEASGEGIHGGIHSYCGSTNGEEEGMKRIFFLEIRDPMEGSWHFRPYCVDWKRGDKPGVTVKSLRVWNRDGQINTYKKERKLSAPSHEDNQCIQVKKEL